MDYCPMITVLADFPEVIFSAAECEGKNVVTRAILIAAALLSSSAHALGDTVRVIGKGNESCGSWLQNRGAQSYAEGAQLSWVTGYVTAFNNYADHRSGDISGGTDADGLFSWIDAYCQGHPLDNLFRASGALIRELEKRAR